MHPDAARRWVSVLIWGWIVLGAGRTAHGVMDPTDPTVPVQALFQQRLFTRADGLPTDEIRALHVARDGVLWIGTGGGLVRYTGHEFQVFDHTSHPEFVSDKVNAIGEGPDGTLWVGTGEGLLSFDRQGVRRYTTADGLTDNEVGILRARRNGEVWFGTEKALHRLANGQVTAWPNLFKVHPVRRDAANESCVRGLLEDSGGTLWALGNYTGLVRWDPRGERFDSVPDPEIEEGHVVGDGMVEDPRGEIWVSRGDGWHYRDTRGWHRATQGQNLSFGLGSVGCADSQAVLWMIDWDLGMRAYRNGRLRLFTPKDGLAGTQITAIVEDQEGALWIGTWTGLNRWLPRRVTLITTDHGLPNDNVWTLASSADGSIWAGTQGGLAQIRSHDRVAPTPGTVTNPRVRSVCEDTAGTLWFAGLDSLASWKPGATAPYPETSLPPGTLRVLASDFQGRLWVGRAEGLLCRTPNGWRSFDATQGLPSKEVRALLMDRQGRLWVGTAGGGVAVANLLQDVQGQPVLKDIQMLTSADGLPSDFVRCLYEDSQGFVWMGTERGLAGLDPKASPTGRAGSLGPIRALHHHPHGAHESLCTLVEDDLGWLWMGSERGICRQPLAELRAAVAGHSNRLDCVSYGLGDGLKSVGTAGQRSQPASAKTRDGHLWFATPSGVVRIDPRHTGEMQSRPMARVEVLQAGNRVLFQAGPGSVSHHLGHLDLAPGAGQFLEIRFDAATYRPEGETRFRYRLIGLNPEWVEADARRTAIYTLLPPGRYRFEVSAAVNQSLWSVEPAEIAFTIAPHLYERLEARVGTAGVFILALLGWARRRERQRQRLAELERLVEVGQERQRIARDIHDDLGAGLTRLVLLGQHARRQASSASDPLVSVLEKVGHEAAGLVDHLGELVWATNPDFDDLPALLSRWREHAAEFLADAGIAATFDFPEGEDLPRRRVSGTVRKNLSYALREALNNAVRHAGATRVDLVCRLSPHHLELSLADNGCGFPSPAGAPPPRGAHGHGLNNLRARLQRIQGTCEVESTPGQGTRVTLRAPLDPEA